MKPLSQNAAPWVDRNVGRFYSALLDEVPNAAWMPRREDDGFEELGCGHYGCVMPTEMPDIVLKLTTDASEAMFARAALSLETADGDNWDFGQWPAGMVRYYAVYQLEGASHYRRPIFAMWRQEATNPGFLTKLALSRSQPSYDQRVARQGLNLLRNMKVAGDAMWEYLVDTKAPAKRLTKALSRRDWGYGRAAEIVDILEKDSAAMYERGGNLAMRLSRHRGADRAAFALGVYEQAAMMLEHNNSLLYMVGSAINYYLEHDIVLGDLHIGNIAMATHPDYDEPVPFIMDPGRAIFLTSKYDSLRIDTIDS